MKQLFILRHAQAANSAGGSDKERPLSGKGREQARYIGEVMASQKLQPDMWLVSSASRTLETCKRVLAAAKYDVSPQIEDKLYLATAGEIITHVNALDDAIESAIVVAHNPGIEQLVKLLCDNKGEAQALELVKYGYPTGTLTLVDVDIEQWSQLQLGDGYVRDCVISER